MRALIQRVSIASVSVSGKKIAETGRGILALVGIGAEDTPETVPPFVDKIVNLRIFEDDSGKFNLSLSEIQGDALLVSQFTLYGDCRKGRRPDFTAAARPEAAKRIYEEFIGEFKRRGIKTSSGEFQAHMMVSSVNDGPVTIMLDTDK
jgi:D-tyrosyl-tRNA(Tyr) deacylase